jgi:hypothetical protein
MRKLTQIWFEVQSLLYLRDNICIVIEQITTLLSAKDIHMHAHTNAHINPLIIPQFL